MENDEKVKTQIDLYANMLGIVGTYNYTIQSPPTNLKEKLLGGKIYKGEDLGIKFEAIFHALELKNISESNYLKLMEQGEQKFLLNIDDMKNSLNSSYFYFLQLNIIERRVYCMRSIWEILNNPPFNSQEDVLKSKQLLTVFNSMLQIELTKNEIDKLWDDSQEWIARDNRLKFVGF